jgi:serine protease inhibitor
VAPTAMPSVYQARDSRSLSAPPSLSMRCDRPYVVVIREKLSGTILFTGKINNIQKKKHAF